MQNDIIFWIWLAERLGAKSRDFRRLIMAYETASNLFCADIAEIEQMEGLTKRTKTMLADRDLHRASKILADCERKDIGILTWGDERYPRRLRELQDPPIVLYYSGVLPSFDDRLCIGMVGTRTMSEYGLRTAYRLAYELASVKVLVVSGMAAGIDGVSASAAMIAGGDTVAVLGCGVDVVYPRYHTVLRDEIRAHGTLISEYAPGTRPSHYHFPARNRIISGLSQGTLVVEAGLGSGSLITAKDAVMQGRDVFAVPANVDGNGAQGTNGLLRDGAYLVLSTEDILRRYPLYDSVIDVGALEEAKTRSRTNMRALARYGVIELVERTEPTEKSTPTEAYTASTPKREMSKKTAEEAVETAPATPRKTPDEILNTLTPVQRAVMEAIPDDQPIAADALSKLDYPYGDVIGALTMLEICGLIRKLPGALYTKV